MSQFLGELEAPVFEDEQLDRGAPIDVGGIMVFERRPGGPPSTQDLQVALSARMSALHRYSQRLSSLRAGHFFWPRWEPDPKFEIGHHIRRAVLPAPGGDRELCDWTAEFFTDPLDWTRPLWELALLEGLPGGRWALAHNVCRYLGEALGSVDAIGLLLDDRPFAADDWRPRASMSPFAAPGPNLDALSPNGHVGQALSYALVRAPRRELQTVGQVLGGGLDDVVLAVCAGGLRRLLIERGERLGNRIGSLFVELPVHEPVAAVRVARIAARTRRLRAERGPMAAEIARSTLSAPRLGVTIANVTGSARPRYAFGAPLREVLPVMPRPAPDTIAIAIFADDGMVSLGLSADRDSTPDLDVLAAGIEAALDELRAYGT